MSLLSGKATVLIMLVSVSYKMQRFAVDLEVAIAGSVVPHWTTHRKVNVLTHRFNSTQSRFKNLIALFILCKHNQVYVCFILELLGISETATC